MSDGSIVRRHATGLLSALCGLLLFAATILGIALALDLTSAVANGVFTESFAQHVQMKIFDGYAGWPVLAVKIGIATEALLLLVGVAVQLFARQQGGAAHILRGLLGVFLLVASLGMLHKSFNIEAWETIPALVADHKIPAATDTFLNHFQPGAIIAAGVFLAANIVFAWPARRREYPMTVPAAAQAGKGA